MAEMFKNLKISLLNNKIKQTKLSAKKQEILLQNKLSRLMGKQVKADNKALKNMLVDALSAEEFFDIKIAKKAKKYDVKAHWKYRKISTAFSQALFDAVRQGNHQLINTLIAQNNEAVSQLKAQRSAFMARWQAKKERYMQAHIVGEQQLTEYKKTFEQQLAERKDALEQLYSQHRAVIEEQIRLTLSNAADKVVQLQSKLSTMLADQYETLPEDTILKINNLCMYFGGLHAVDELSFDVKKGEIFGLIGPNGAGKTTVFNCITQFYKPTKGEILFNNKEGATVKLTNYIVHDIVLEGISRTFQNVEVIKEVSVLDNLLIAATRFYTSNLAEQALHLRILKIEESIMKAKAERILELLGLASYKDWYAYGLPYGILKKIEIARALMVEPKLIILDEPAAGLNDTETKELAKLIKRIRDEFNCTILLVEHDMSLVMSVCDRICAISFGKMLALGTPREIQVNKQVQEAYLGVSEQEGE